MENFKIAGMQEMSPEELMKVEGEYGLQLWLHWLFQLLIILEISGLV